MSDSSSPNPAGWGEPVAESPIGCLATLSYLLLSFIVTLLLAGWVLIRFGLVEGEAEAKSEWNIWPGIDDGFVVWVSVISAVVAMIGMFAIIVRYNSRFPATDDLPDHPFAPVDRQ